MVGFAPEGVRGGRQPEGDEDKSKDEIKNKI